MKKILIISSFFLILIAFSTIGYSIVSANEQIKIVNDEIEKQSELDEYLTPYGYTLDNPNLILNPYGISPLTALLLFETKEEVPVTITIEGKDINSTYTNTFEPTTKHYIPIYGLYPDSTNIIHIECGNLNKIIEIKTDPLPIDLIPEPVNNPTNNLYFITSSNYPYALDNNNEIRWYLTKPYTKKITRLENGNLLLSTDTLNQNKKPIGLVELNLLGKILKQYNINNGYYGSHAQIDNHLLILSKDLLEIDKQTGTIIKAYPLENSYDTVSYDQETDTITLINQTETLKINRTTEERTTEIQIESAKPNETEAILSLYTNQQNYKITEGIKFSTNPKTKESEKDIFLVGYKKIDDNYKKHQIKIEQTKDNIQIKGNFANNEEVYLILDKFLDKRVYDIIEEQTIINKFNLSGKYSIYIKINDTIYKTNTFIEV